MTMSTLWTRIDPTVQQWLLGNPGCVVLPRTMVNRVEATIGAPMATDGHGEYLLTEEDREFLRNRRSVATSGHRPDASAAVRREDHAEVPDR